MPSPNAHEIAAALIMDFEGFRPYPYADPASKLYRAIPDEPWGHVPPAQILSKQPEHVVELSGVPWTIGYGRTVGVNMFALPTTKEAERAHLMKRIADDDNWLYNLIDSKPYVKVEDHHVAALLSLIYNIGRTKFSQSTLLKKLLRNDFDGAAKEFERWKFAGGKVMRGLELRRERERDVFLGKVSP